jgi:hypothetical protein
MENVAQNTQTQIETSLRSPVVPPNLPMLDDATLTDEQRRSAHEFYGGLVQQLNAWRRMFLPKVKPCSKCGK